MMMNDWIPYKEDPEKGFFNWLKIRRRMHKKGNQDTVIVVCGPEQSGKSRWTVRTIYGLDKSTFIKNGKIDISLITVKGKDFRYNATHNEKTIIQDDEAVTHFYSRRAMSEENVLCNQVVATCGSMNNILFLLIPSFFVLDSYIKEHRVKAVVKIYPGNKFKTWVFVNNKGNERNKDKLEKIIKDKKFSVKHSSKGWWSEKNNTEELNLVLKEYFKKAKREKQKVGEALSKKEGTFRKEKDVIKELVCNMYKTKKYTQAQLADMFDVSRQTIIKYLNELVKNVRE